MDTIERNKRVEENLKLVSHALSLLKVPWNEDYFQQGVLELIRCAENYDNSKGYKFSTYAIKCITLKLKDYIKRDYVLKPKLTGEKGGKVYAPPTISLNSVVYDSAGDKAIFLEDVIEDDVNWDEIDLGIELDNLVEKEIISKDELQLFIDSEVNGYPLKMLTKKYNVTNRVARGIISRVRETLAENISYNYYEGGQ